MNFLIIPDSFKDCLSSSEVGQAIASGIHAVFSDANTKIIPIADGGEGTVEALSGALEGKIIKTKAHDALMRPIDSFYGVSKDGKTAIIEMAAASGIELLTKEERNPLLTTTYGTGELMKAALEYGCTKIIIGIGGSATNDGGTGMASALGAQFFNADQKSIAYGGGGLESLHSIDISGLDSRLCKVNIHIACDVKNTLCGAHGASTVYGPQKGASKEMVEKLDANLNHLSTILKKQIKVDVLNLEGGGAAGGLGAGLFAFAGGKLERGFDIISNILDLENNIATSDVIISAEGAVDYQTLFGKTPAGVAAIAKKYNKPVFVFAGNATADIEDLKDIGITSLVPITRQPIDLTSALEMAPKWLKLASIELCSTLKAGINLNSK